MLHGYDTPPKSATQSEFKWSMGGIPLKFKPKFYCGPPESDESDADNFIREKDRKVVKPSDNE